MRGLSNIAPKKLTIFSLRFKIQQIRIFILVKQCVGKSNNISIKSIS